MTDEICLKVMTELFDITKGHINLDDYDYIFINLNSILNSLFYEDMKETVADSEFREKLKLHFKSALMSTYRANKYYYIYYSSKPSSNKDNHPSWDEQLNGCKFDKDYFDLFKEFISAMHVLADSFNNIKMIDTLEMESSYIPYLFWKTHMQNSKSLIISRDMMDFLNIKYGFHLYDSTNLMMATDKHESKKIPKIHKNLISYFFFLVGMKKHSYKGIRGFANKKAMDYLIKNIDTIKEDVLFKDKAFSIFSHKKMIENNPNYITIYTKVFNNIDI